MGDPASCLDPVGRSPGPAELLKLELTVDALVAFDCVVAAATIDAAVAARAAAADAAALFCGVAKAALVTGCGCASSAAVTDDALGPAEPFDSVELQRCSASVAPPAAAVAAAAPGSTTLVANRRLFPAASGATSAIGVTGVAGSVHVTMPGAAASDTIAGVRDTSSGLNDVPGVLGFDSGPGEAPGV